MERIFLLPFFIGDELSFHSTTHKWKIDSENRQRKIILEVFVIDEQTLRMNKL